jgi:hypothetical protein
MRQASPWLACLEETGARVSGEGEKLQRQQETVFFLQHPHDAGLGLEGGRRLLLVARLTRMGWARSNACLFTSTPMPLALRSRQTPPAPADAGTG